MRKAISVTWFNHLSYNFGIVITENSIGENKAWIGIGIGNDEIEDIIKIANYGAKFPLEAANILVKERGRGIITFVQIPNK